MTHETKMFSLDQVVSGSNAAEKTSFPLVLKKKKTAWHMIQILLPGKKCKIHYQIKNISSHFIQMAAKLCQSQIINTKA